MTTYRLVSVKGSKSIDCATLDEAIAAARRMDAELQPAYGVEIHNAVGDELVHFDGVRNATGNEVAGVDGDRISMLWIDLADDVAETHIAAIGWRPQQGVSDAALGLGDSWGGCPDGIAQADWSHACEAAVRRMAQEQLDEDVESRR